MITHTTVTAPIWGVLGRLLDQTSYVPEERIFVHHPGTHNPDHYCVETRHKADSDHVNGLLNKARRLVKKQARATKAKNTPPAPDSDDMELVRRIREG